MRAFISCHCPAFARSGRSEWVAQCVALALASLTGRLWRLTGGLCPDADTLPCVGCILHVHRSLTRCSLVMLL